jgi:predicted nucleotidyltransferase
VGSGGRSTLKEMAKHERRRQAQRSRRASLQATLARQEAQRLTQAFLSLAPDIEKIVLFGSLAHGRSFSTRSDIDLAVRCPKEAFLSLVAEALRSPFSVDVIDLSDADARILASIERDGVVIYEK